MTDERGRRYDTFVVRVWRDLISQRVLRAEVEHVQSGQRAERRWSETSGSDEDGLGWIAKQLGHDRPRNDE